MKKHNPISHTRPMTGHSVPPVLNILMLVLLPQGQPRGVPTGVRRSIKMCSSEEPAQPRMKVLASCALGCLKWMRVISVIHSSGWWVIVLWRSSVLLPRPNP